MVPLGKCRFLLIIACCLGLVPVGDGFAESFRDSVYDPGKLKPVDSTLKVKVGEPAPDFTLPAVAGEPVTLSHYRDRKHVVISFVPAAWTPVCSDQWPGYNIVQSLFDKNDAVLLGITVDNLPTLHAWTRQMGDLWFPVLSDFWPHGAVADRYGVLRSDGMFRARPVCCRQDGHSQSRPRLRYQCPSRPGVVCARG